MKILKDMDEIYRLYADDVYRYLLKLSGDAHHAEELTQETFFRAVQNIERFRGESSMKGWLLVIAKNAFFSWKRSPHAQSLSLADLPAEPIAAENLADCLLQKEEARRLHRALHHLPEPYKEVFSLRVFGELPFQEIAALFEKTESWAKVTFYRAKCRLLDAIHKEDAI